MLSFCDGCKIVIRKTHFSCGEGCGFHLCLDCAATSPHVDTKSRRLEQVDHAMIKKELENYEKGWDGQFVGLAVEVFKDLDSAAQGLENLSGAINKAANLFDF
jgi:hypothetical protein